MGSDDHSLLILPLFHVNGICGQHVVAAHRGEAARPSPAASVRTPSSTGVEKSKVDLFLGGSNHVHDARRLCLTTVRPDTSSVRFAICGAAPASVELLDRVRDPLRHPTHRGVRVVGGDRAPAPSTRSTGSASPVPSGFPTRQDRRFAIVGPDDISVPEGEVGEVLIKGPNVMRGYLNRPEETAKTIVGGWLHTGDIGRLDDDGYLVLVDRAKDMIIRGGENIYPKEIEAVVYQLPEIARGRRDRPRQPGVRRGAGAVRSPEPGGRIFRMSASTSTCARHCRNSNCPSRSRLSTICLRTRSARSTNPRFENRYKPKLKPLLRS